MSKPKALALSQKHRTKAETEQRVEREALARPRAEISLNPPLELRGHKLASATWRDLIKLYEGTEGELVTAFDARHLTHYCIITEQIAELDLMRAAALAAFKLLLKPKKSRAKGKSNSDTVFGLGAAMDRVITIDARVDRKRALLLAHANALYLTPKARAGAAPVKKTPDVEPSEMDQILGDAGWS